MRKTCFRRNGEITNYSTGTVGDQYRKTDSGIVHLEIIVSSKIGPRVGITETRLQTFCELKYI